MPHARWLSALIPFVALACGDGFTDGALEGAPPGGPPSSPPPTGSKWEGVEVEGECGRTTISYVLVDEVCGGTTAPDYMASFHAPVMRDGARLGDVLFAVDASYLWVLDVADATAPTRRALLSGFGQPMALATHGGHLLIAAGEEGLLRVDASNPDAPVRLVTLALEGPALDVYVEGDQAFVATGAGGVAVIDLSDDDLSLVKVLDVPGFAAAVAAEGGTAFVAACDTFATIDVDSGNLLAQTWIDGAVENGVIVAPAKDVALDGDRAFVAAGRFGAVEIDITDRAAPVLGGNCTIDDDLTFYASGVRHDGERLFIAGGEWGILPVPLTSPISGCAAIIAPELPPTPDGSEACSSEPPWEVLPWEETWLPPPVPPPGRDPLQTLPEGGRVWAFGDATRIGLRAIDVRDGTQEDLPKIGRYAEPRLTEGIAAFGDRVLVAGKVGGLYRVGDSALLELETAIPEAATARAAAFLPDGRWVLGSPDPDTGFGSLLVEGGAAIPVDAQIWPGSLVTQGSSVFVATTSTVNAVHADTGVTEYFGMGRTAELPPSLALSGTDVLVASPEWPDALRIGPGGTITPFAAQGVVDQGALLDVSRWQKGLPRRLLLPTTDGALELVSLGGQAGFTLHRVQETTGELPSGDYLAAAVSGDRAYAISVDRGRYRTQLVTLRLSTTPPTIESVIGFTGMATGAAASGDRLYVADGDRGIRVYDVASGAPEALGTVELSPATEVQP